MLEVDCSQRRGRRKASFRFVRSLTRLHLDAFRYRAYGIANGAAGAIVGDERQVRLGVEGDRLITGIVASHITFSAIDTHVLNGNRKMHDKEEWEKQPLTSSITATTCCLLSKSP